MYRVFHTSKNEPSHFLSFRKLESERRTRIARVNAIRKRDHYLRYDYYHNFLRNVTFSLVTLTNS